MSRRKRIWTAGVTLLFLPLAFSTTARASEERTFGDLATCINEKRSLDVLMLVDESKSLRELDGKPGNDPGDARVEALMSVVEVLHSSVAATAGFNASDVQTLQIRISLSGFGAGYSTHLDFTELNDASLPAIRTALKGQSERDDQKYTRYHKGLEGAKQSFEKAGGDACRMLMWFSDGQHDDDNARGFNSKERQQIESEVCGADGLVNQLRSSGVFILAAGLNKEPKQLGLMRMIAVGDEPYESDGFAKSKNAKSVKVNSCGEIMPFGSFQLASNADEIVDSIFEGLKELPGVPDPRNTPVLVDCEAEAGLVCKELSFTADDTISAFNILASRPSADVEVVLSGPDFAPRRLLGKNEDPADPMAVDIVRFTNVSRNRVLISASKSKSRDLSGEWVLQFNGPDAANSKGSVSFVGQADVVLDPPYTDQGLKINRFAATDIKMKVAPSAGSMEISRLDVALIGGLDKKTVEYQPGVGKGSFVVDRSTIQSILQADPFGSLASLQLSVQPVGDISGLKMADGSPIPIDYPAVRFEVFVNNGAGSPTFKGVEADDLLFKGTPRKTVGLRFVGADSGNSEIRIGQFEAGDQNAGLFEVVESSECKLAPREEKVCFVDIKPNKETYGAPTLLLKTEFVGADGKPSPKNIPITVQTEKSINPWPGLWAALLLLVSFFVVQGLIRFGVSVLISRFAPLPATSLRVRFDTTVTPEGVVSLNPKRVSPDRLEQGFAIENSESESSFDVFGFEFSCSPWRTFKRSTSRPLGDVSKSGFVVIGSRGVREPKKGMTPTVGQVDLALAGQWALAISEVNVQRLVDGVGSVDGELIAYLAPLTQVDLATQELNLSMEMASSNVGSDLAGLVERLREEAEAASVDEVTGPGAAEAGIDVPATADPNDRFSGFASPQVVHEEPPRPRRRKLWGRKRRDSAVQSSYDTQFGDSGGTPPGPPDRFS